MKKIKLLTTIVILIQLFIFIVLWFLPYDNVYKLTHTINSIFVLITGFLMVKYIIKINKKVISKESISKTLLNLSLDGIYIENERGEILECNQSGHEMFGYTKKEMENDLREMTIRDELTKIYNRRYIMQKLKDEFFLSKTNKSTFSIALLDIDDFKKVNENFGHLFGDEVLIKFSDTIIKNLRKTDHFGRIGGEEFIIIFCNTFLVEGYDILFRTKEKLSSISWKVNNFSVTFSAGLFEVSHKNIDKHNSEKIMKLIDDLMYKAKTSGKNCIITPNSQNSL